MRHTRTGFTLVEFMMAATIMSIIALSVAGVFGALSNAYCGSQVYYQTLQTAQSSMTRVQAMVHKAKLVTAATSSSLVLWAGDTNEDGTINLSEIAVLQYDSDHHEVREIRVVFPENMDVSTKTVMDAPKLLSTLTDITEASNTVGSVAYTRETVLASDVWAFRVAVTPQPPMSNLVKIELEIGPEGQRFILRSACSLRADVVADVGTVHGDYVLTTEDVSGG